MRDELDNIKRMGEEEKNRQISLYRDKANIYWEKANDKEQQLAALRDTHAELKMSCNELQAQLKQIRESQNNTKQQELNLKKM